MKKIILFFLINLYTFFCFASFGVISPEAKTKLWELSGSKLNKTTHDLLDKQILNIERNWYSQSHIYKELKKKLKPPYSDSSFISFHKNFILKEELQTRIDLATFYLPMVWENLEQKTFIYLNSYFWSDISLFAPSLDKFYSSLHKKNILNTITDDIKNALNNFEYEQFLLQTIRREWLTVLSHYHPSVSLNYIRNLDIIREKCENQNWLNFKDAIDINSLYLSILNGSKPKDFPKFSDDFFIKNIHLKQKYFIALLLSEKYNEAKLFNSKNIYIPEHELDLIINLFRGKTAPINSKIKIFNPQFQFFNLIQDYLYNPTPENFNPIESYLENIPLEVSIDFFEKNVILEKILQNREDYSPLLKLSELTHERFSKIERQNVWLHNLGIVTDLSNYYNQESIDALESTVESRRQKTEKQKNIIILFWLAIGSLFLYIIIALISYFFNKKLVTKIKNSTKEKEIATNEEIAVQNKLKTSNYALSKYAQVVSHDIRQPLRIIISFSEIIQKEIQKGRDKVNSSKIKYLAHDLLYKVEDLSHMITMEQYKNNEVTTFENILDTVNTKFKSRVLQRKIVFYTDDIPNSFTCEKKIAEVLTNLGMCINHLGNVNDYQLNISLVKNKADNVNCFAIHNNLWTKQLIHLKEELNGHKHSIWSFNLKKLGEEKDIDIKIKWEENILYFTSPFF